MPILNFMQWLKIPTLSNKVSGESIVMTATPNGTDYDSAGITVSQLAANLKGLVIPKLNVFQGRDGLLSVSYLPSTGNDIWKSYNPKVYLFRYSGKKKRAYYVSDPRGKERKKIKYIKAGFKHIPHLMGAKHKGAFYAGETHEVFNTEFELLVNQPYMSQPLYDFDPNQFYTNTKDGTRFTDGTLSDMLAAIVPSNRRNKESAKSVYLKFAIGIENPDKDSEFPIIFGEFSDVIQLLPYVNNGFVKIRYNFVPTGIKRKLRIG